MPCGFLKTCLCLWWGYVLCNLFHVRWCALLTLLDWKLEVRIITRVQMLHDFLHDFSHTSSVGFIWQCLIWKWQEENNKHEPKTASSKTASVTWFVTWTVTYIILHTSSPNTNPGLKRLPFELNKIWLILLDTGCFLHVQFWTTPQPSLPKKKEGKEKMKLLFD